MIGDTRTASAGFTSPDDRFTIRFVRVLFLTLLSSSAALAQNPPANPAKPDQGPPVKVNILNVCTPGADEQKEMRSALARLPKAPAFVTDYEIARGISTVEEGKSAKYIRLRREFKSDSPLQTIQYSLSSDDENTIETLVFRGRDVKDLLALSIEDRLSTSVSKPSTVIQTDTPASRLRVERAGKTTLALARCEGADQSQYEPIFAQASAALADYRRLLKLRTMLAGDIAWLNSGSPSGSSAPPERAGGAKKSAATPESPSKPH
jgi:hypothetical protein